jgi:hypothetical protein
MPYLDALGDAPPSPTATSQQPPTDVAMRIGIAKGAFELPDDIDIDNLDIAVLFGAE